MRKHRSEWDVTTAEGRIALERYLMKRIGYIDEDPNNPWEGWFIVQTLDGYREYLPDHVEPGWVFTPDGMVALKKWAAEEKGIVISSEFHPDGAGRKAQGIARCWELVSGKELALERADIEEDAVALALARALEEMGKAS